MVTNFQYFYAEFHSESYYEIFAIKFKVITIHYPVSKGQGPMRDLYLNDIFYFSSRLYKLDYLLIRLYLFIRMAVVYANSISLEFGAIVVYF